MSEEFIKPDRRVIDPIPYLKSIVGNGLIKDLHDGEIICPECQGTGWRISNAPYGLSDDPGKKAGMFPYKHQSISFCQHCYNGVLKICPHCGEVIPRSKLYCDCEKSLMERSRKEAEKETAILNKARKIEPDSPEAIDMEMYYSEHYGHNEGYFSDWDELFDYLSDNCGDEEIYTRPEYVYGTHITDISIDAADVIENATSDLHEEAYNRISDKDKKELQDFLDAWCAKQTGTKTYWQDNGVAVRIPWEDYDER